MEGAAWSKRRRGVLPTPRLRFPERRLRETNLLGLVRVRSHQETAPLPNSVPSGRSPPAPEA